jgi:drug/metabolite transporter (DMT)-like permease
MSSVYFRLVLTTLIWALVFYSGVYAVGFMHPLAVAAWRFVLAALVLLPLVRVREGWPRSQLHANAWALIGMALSGVFVFNVAMFYGLAHTSALNAALIMALSPALTTVLAASLARNRIRPLQWLGLALGVAGVACVVSNGSWTLLRQLRLSSGDALMLLASVSWSIYATIPDRYIRDLSALQSTGASTVVGAALLAVLALAAAPQPLLVGSLRLLAILVFMAVAGTALALVWWNEGVQRLGPGRATLFLNFTPVFAALIATALGKPPSWAHAIGAVLVIGGVTCSSRA